jgi:hypothetical protein
LKTWSIDPVTTIAVEKKLIFNQGYTWFNIIILLFLSKFHPQKTEIFKDNILNQVYPWLNINFFSTAIVFLIVIVITIKLYDQKNEIYWQNVFNLKENETIPTFN